jgi:exosortase/archaeosortase family protein
MFEPAQRVLNINGYYTGLIVYCAAGVISLLMPCSYSGTLINLPTIALDIKFGCNGLETVMIYSAAVVIYPAVRRMKLTGIALGFVLIQIVNIMRIVLLAYVATHYEKLFHITHIYIAQGITIALALGAFALYTTYADTAKTSC